MKVSAIAAALCTGLLATSAAHAVLNVDVQGSTGVTQAGFQPLTVNGSGDGVGLYPTSFGNVTITVAGAGERLRSVVAGDPFPDVNRDFSFQDGDGTSMTVTIAGLNPGQYDFRSFHHDTGTGGVNLFDLTLTDATGTNKVLDSVDWDRAGYSYLVESNGGLVTLLIQEDSTTNRNRFNGIQISQVVPEPATATLGLLAFGGMMLRRRRTA